MQLVKSEVSQLNEEQANITQINNLTQTTQAAETIINLNQTVSNATTMGDDVNVNDPIELNQQNEDYYPPEIILNTYGHIGPNGNNFPPFPPYVYYHKFNHIFRPILEKISKISAIVSHPNGGWSSLWRPSQVWHKIQKKGQEIFSGLHGSIYGFGQLGGHDYPFAYKSN